MKKYILTLTILFLSLSAAFGAGEMPPSKVALTEIRIERVAETKSFLGLIYYEQTSRLSSEVQGLTESVEVSIGDHVAKGEPLIRLNTEILDTDLALSTTRVEQSGLRTSHTEKQYKRLEKLYQDKGVSEREYENAFFAYHDNLMEKQAADETLQKLTIQKRKSVILAPYDCVILEKNIDAGDWVQPGKQLLRIGSTAELHIRVPVAEKLLQFVTVGTEVPVTINAFNKELVGIIQDFNPVADEQTKNIFLNILIPTQEKVAENMSATVTIPVSAPKELSIIPRDALIKFQGQDSVYTVKDNKASLLTVNIVAFLGNEVGADNSYLTAGLPIVIEGNERLRPDQPVTISGDN